MIAVYSFYSKPYLLKKTLGWARPGSMFKSLIISHSLAKKHFGKTHLVTDDFGKYILIDILKMDFDIVTTDLNSLNYSPDFWMIGKIKAYQIQTSPFIHIDGDAFLWEKPSDEILKSNIFTQSIEEFDRNIENPTCYTKPVKFIENANWLPESFFKILNTSDTQYAANTGIYGINDLSINIKFTSDVFTFLDIIDNKEFLINSKDMYQGLNTVIEQYFLMNNCLYYDTNITFAMTDVDFTSWFSKYTHFIAGGKHNTSNLQLIDWYFKDNFKNKENDVLNTIKEFNNQASTY